MTFLSQLHSTTKSLHFNVVYRQANCIYHYLHSYQNRTKTEMNKDEEKTCPTNKLRTDKKDLSPVRNSDGTIKLRNPNIALMDQDILYHIALGSGSHDLVEMFGDTKFVVMGGTPDRMKNFADFIMKEIDYKLPTGTQLTDISQHSFRYSMYKVGPVVAVSHGMGTPSVGILLHELIKLMYHAKAKDPIFFRIGTCGGIGLEPGTVVISNETVNGMLRNTYELPIFGKMTCRPAKLDSELVNELTALADPNDHYQTVSGKTMCTDDFYQGQGRLDGAFCDYSESDKLEFLQKLHKLGIMNIEMESTVIAALTHQAGIKTAIVCTTLLNRLLGDQVSTPKEILTEWQVRPQILVARYIKKYMKKGVRLSGSDSVCIKSPQKLKMVQEKSCSYE